MTMNEQEKQQQLSKAIDAMNQGSQYPADRETGELLETARLIKRSGVVDQASARRIAETVELLAAELSSQKRKRRYFWSFSGAAGAIAAAWLLITLNTNMLIPEDVNRNYSQNQSDLTQIVQIQREQPMASEMPAAPKTVADAATVPAPAENAAPRSAAELNVRKQATEVKIAAKQPEATSNDKMARQSAQQGLLALKGRDARSKSIDAATGEIRQIYSTDSGEITLVQSSKAKSEGTDAQAAAVAGGAVAARSMAKAEGADEKAAIAAKETKQVNRVAVTVEGVEATIEGEQPEEELKKIADTVVKQ